MSQRFVLPLQSAGWDLVDEDDLPIRELCGRLLGAELGDSLRHPNEVDRGRVVRVRGLLELGQRSILIELVRRRQIFARLNRVEVFLLTAFQAEGNVVEAFRCR